MRKQLHGGYLLSSIKAELRKLEKPIIIDDILRQLSSFSIEYHFEESTSEDSALAVLENIISRGLPTLPSLLIEDTFSKELNTSEEQTDKIGSISYSSTDSLRKNIQLIYQSLFIVEPRFNLSVDSFNFTTWDEEPGSKQEEIFFTSIIPKHFHEAYCQILEPQKRIIDILHHSDHLDSSNKRKVFRSAAEFQEQRVDFCFDLPHAIDNADCLAIEIDGPQHFEESQKRFDNKRDNLLKDLGWAPTIRLKTSTFNDLPSDDQESIAKFLSHPYAEQIKENYTNPIWEKEYGSRALQIALSPFAIARVQKSILFLIKNGILNLNADKWNIAIIERDVPCASLAIKDLVAYFDNLFVLEGKGRSLPDIQYHIFVTDEFFNCDLNKKTHRQSFDDFDESENFDAIIDISVLQRLGFDHQTFVNSQMNDNYLKVRSSHSIITDRKINSAQPIEYEFSLDNVPSSLVYFLRNIFRKEDFLQGQAKILQRSLAMKSVIALLPTGAGKSLTYQLSALLQPGIVVVIDPLISLMRDQNDNLQEFGIDSTTFINSTIHALERAKRTEQLINGQYQFVFISPERLQIDEFRQLLLELKDTYFTYGIVDEAHCVSEWGHDFRTAYLRLGENIRKYCKTLSGEIPILALTGTASYDVLADVQRELMIGEEASIVSPEEYKREELDFKIIHVVPEIKDSFREFKLTNYYLRQEVAKYKTTAITHILNNEITNKNWGNGKTYKSLEDFFSREKEYPNSGIVFCPHIRWVFGVKNVAAEVKENFPFLQDLTGIYAGGLSDDELVDLEEVQNQFKNDDLALLVATKAFGMGIDKPNIRFTIHFSMPQSIESFYQEAGRAGRDKDPANCYILYSSTQSVGKDNPVSVDKDLMLAFHNNSFQGIDKEKNIIWELLNEIIFPSVTVNLLLSDVINKYDQDINFNLYPKDNPKTLYINAEFPKTLGSINLITKNIYPETRPEKKILDPSEAVKEIRQILQNIQKLCPENVSLRNWLANPSSVGSQPGMEKILEDMNFGEYKQVAIGFENDRISKIEDYLSNHRYGYHQGLVQKASQYCSSSEKFIERLASALSRKNDRGISFSEEDKISLKKLFLQIRGDQETHKAIYRLSIIGVIDDFVVDYNANAIIAKISKKEDHQYVDNLTEYIGRYVSAEEKSRTPQAIMNAQGNSVIQKCCGYLIGFVYEKIASKRKEAINVMESAIQAGINNDRLFAERINSYFDSKYTPELRKYLIEYSIDLVWEYMDKTNNDPDAISHLIGACDRLLVENPQNSAFLLLRSYAKLVSQSYDKKEAIDDFKKGWQLYTENENFTRKKYLRHLSSFYEKTVRNDTRLKEYLDPIILQEHHSWLTEFNINFLKDFEYAQHK